MVYEISGHIHCFMWLFDSKINELVVIIPDKVRWDVLYFGDVVLEGVIPDLNEDSVNGVQADRMLVIFA